MKKCPVLFWVKSVEGLSQDYKLNGECVFQSTELLISAKENAVSEVCNSYNSEIHFKFFSKYSLLKIFFQATGYEKTEDMVPSAESLWLSRANS